jgi:hypothetical protein
MELSRYQEMVHLIATPVMVILYTIRLVVLMRLKMTQDRSPDPKGDLSKGIREAFITLVAPWKMDSTRRHWTYYLEFMLFHLGIAFNISLAYLITYARSMFTEPVRAVFEVIIGLGLIVGIIRIFNRFVRPDMRIISSFDDYFTLFLLMLFNIGGILTLRGVEWGSYLYFTVVGTFLVYAGFSKIHHYLYYPFARFFYGADAGRKGLYKEEVRHA